MALVLPQVRRTLVYDENLTGPSREQTDPSYANSTTHRSSPGWSQARSPPSQMSAVSWPPPTYGILASNIIIIIIIVLIVFIVFIVVIIIVIIIIIAIVIVIVIVPSSPGTTTTGRGTLTGRMRSRRVRALRRELTPVRRRETHWQGSICFRG